MKNLFLTLNKNTNLINLIGIQLYFILYYIYYSKIALIIYINGLITHSLIKSKYYHLIKSYDIFSNIILITYGNLNTNLQPYTYYITLISILVYIYKRMFIKNRYLNQFVHVNFIHIPFAYCLYRYFIQ